MPSRSTNIAIRVSRIPPSNHPSGSNFQVWFVRPARRPSTPHTKPIAAPMRAIFVRLYPTFLIAHTPFCVLVTRVTSPRKDTLLLDLNSAALARLGYPWKPVKRSFGQTEGGIWRKKDGCGEGIRTLDLRVMSPT